MIRAICGAFIVVMLTFAASCIFDFGKEETIKYGCHCTVTCIGADSQETSMGIWDATVKDDRIQNAESKASANCESNHASDCDGSPRCQCECWEA